MSKDNVKDFFEELGKNPALKEKFLGEMKDSDDVKRVVSFAANAGFVFSEKDIDELCDEKRGNSELADEDLAKAAGGFGCQRLVSHYMSSKTGKLCYLW